jgi:hypothetical protein
MAMPVELTLEVQTVRTRKPEVEVGNLLITNKGVFVDGIEVERVTDLTLRWHNDERVWRLTTERIVLP